MFDIAKVFFKTLKTHRAAKKIYESDLYYSDLNEIPLFNWWKCSEGDYSYLWKERRRTTPFFFKRIFSDMSYQMDFIDLCEIRRQVESNYFFNKFLVEQNIKYKRKADAKKAESEMLKSEEKPKSKLNDLIKFVQMSLNLSFQVDPLKITAGYFFNLYFEAVKKQERGNN